MWLPLPVGNGRARHPAPPVVVVELDGEAVGRHDAGSGGKGPCPAPLQFNARHAIVDSPAPGRFKVPGWPSNFRRIFFPQQVDRYLQRLAGAALHGFRPLARLLGFKVGLKVADSLAFERTQLDLNTGPHRVRHARERSSAIERTSGPATLIDRVRAGVCAPQPELFDVIARG